MFAHVASVTLKIMTFRAGPAELPYSLDLTRALLPAAVVANFWVFAKALPLAMSVVMAIGMVAAIALATNGLLKARKMDNRFNQTFNALLLTGTLLNLLMLAPFSAVAPMLVKAAQNPQLLEHPEDLNLPQGAVMLMNLLNFWNFAVTAHIFRKAMEVNFGIGLLLALLVAFAALMFIMISGTMAGAIFS